MISFAVVKIHSGLLPLGPTPAANWADLERGDMQQKVAE